MFDLIPFVRNNHLWNAFDDSFFRDMGPAMAGFKTDIVDEGDHYLLSAELPGFAKEDIHIDLDGDYLTVRAEHSEDKENRDEKNYLRRERHYGSYSRSFNIAEVKAEEITAAYNDGVLTLTLPKKSETKALPRTIEIR